MAKQTNTVSGRPGAHLLKHGVTAEVRAAAAAALGTDPSIVGPHILQLRQPELRQVFQQVYSVHTASGNNGWMRGKLLQAVGLDTRWTPNVQQQDRGQAQEAEGSEDTKGPSQRQRRPPTALQQYTRGDEQGEEEGSGEKQNAAGGGNKRARQCGSSTLPPLQLPGAIDPAAPPAVVLMKSDPHAQLPAWPACMQLPPVAAAGRVSPLQQVPGGGWHLPLGMQLPSQQQAQQAQQAHLVTAQQAQQEAQQQARLMQQAHMQQLRTQHMQHMQKQQEQQQELIQQAQQQAQQQVWLMQHSLMQQSQTQPQAQQQQQQQTQLLSQQQALREEHVQLLRAQQAELMQLLQQQAQQRRAHQQGTLFQHGFSASSAPLLIQDVPIPQQQQGGASAQQAALQSAGILPFHQQRQPAQGGTPVVPRQLEDQAPSPPLLPAPEIQPAPGSATSSMSGGASTPHAVQLRFAAAPPSLAAPSPFAAECGVPLPLPERPSQAPSPHSAAAVPSLLPRDVSLLNLSCLLDAPAPAFDLDNCSLSAILPSLPSPHTVSTDLHHLFELWQEGRVSLSASMPPVH